VTDHASKVKKPVRFKGGLGIGRAGFHELCGLREFVSRNQ